MLTRMVLYFHSLELVPAPPLPTTLLTPLPPTTAQSIGSVKSITSAGFNLLKAWSCNAAMPVWMNIFEALENWKYSRF